MVVNSIWYAWDSAICSTTQHWELNVNSLGKASYNLINTAGSEGLVLSKAILLAIINLLLPKFKAKSKYVPVELVIWLDSWVVKSTTSILGIWVVFNLNYFLSVLISWI